MKKFYLFQRLDTLEYFGTYRGDDYWTKDITDAYQYEEKKESNFDLYSSGFTISFPP